MTTTKTRGISKKNAEALWNELASNLLAAEESIKEIIKNRAWEPLGYESFYEAWNDRMSHIEIARDFRGIIVYQMLAEGHSDNEIAHSVKGVGPETALGFRRDRAAGVPADKAKGKVLVSPFERKAPASEQYRLTLVFSVEEIRAFSAKAKALGASVDAVAIAAVRAAFSEL